VSLAGMNRVPCASEKISGWLEALVKELVAAAEISDGHANK